MTTPPEQSLAIRTRGLVKNFGSNRAVDHINLEVAQGEIFGVLGPNGAGKTTMLRMLATLLPIDSGSAEIFGVDVAKRPHVVRQLIGLTGQYASVDEDLTAIENLVLFGRLQGLAAPRAKVIAGELLEQFSLEEAATRKLAKFSGGMRRRLDLAVSLITRPPLIFLDEPTTGLDPHSRNELWEVLRNLVKRGTTLVLTTQYLEEADQLADRIVVIDQGRIIAEGTPLQLKDQAGSASVVATLTDAGDLAAAHSLVSAVADGIFVDEGARSLTIPAGGLPDLTRVAQILDESGLAVDDLSLSRPSLDDVFLSLTGRRTTSDETEEDQK